MTTFESIMNDARSLDPAERIRLARQLLKEAKIEETDDEVGVGERGLAAWTESTRDEDWSEHYPPSLQRRKAG